MRCTCPKGQLLNGATRGLRETAGAIGIPELVDSTAAGAIAAFMKVRAPDAFDLVKMLSPSTRHEDQADHNYSNQKRDRPNVALFKADMQAPSRAVVCEHAKQGHIIGSEGWRCDSEAPMFSDPDYACDQCRM